MVRNPNHEMQSPLNHDERSLQQYVLSLKHHLGREIQPLKREIYERRAKPAFKKAHGREPETWREIGDVMLDDPDYQMSIALNTMAQDLMWESVADPIYRNIDNLGEKYRELTESPKKKGSLEIDPNFKVPKGMSEVGVHRQLGSYAFDRGEGDVTAGALYEGGGNIYSMGIGVGTGYAKGEIVQAHLRKEFPEFDPKMILDIGCSAGSSSTPYAMAYPHAEVHAIDVAPGLLRYAHARAESLDVAVHFHQRDAADTKFPDNTFDLVVSHNAMHEMPQKTTENMFKESFRILKPGGIAVHQDLQLRFDRFPLFEQFDFRWDQLHNNEPFLVTYATNDPEEMFRKAGFADDDIFSGLIDQPDGTMKWFVSLAQKPKG